MQPRITSFFLLILCFWGAAALAQDKPNVVVMMVDNLGWGELGVYGGGKLRGAATPRLDELASEGMLLQNFNVEPQCTLYLQLASRRVCRSSLSSPLRSSLPLPRHGISFEDKGGLPEGPLPAGSSHPSARIASDCY